MNRRLLAAMAAIALAGCAVGPGYHRPDLATPATYRPSSPGADSLKPFFDSLRTRRDTLLPPALDSLSRRSVHEAPLPDSLASVGWFDLLPDPVLQDLVRTALRENRDVRVAIAVIAQSRAQLGVTRGDLFPQLNLNGQGGTNQVVFGTLGTQSFNILQATANLSWEIDFWGKLRRATQAARADLLASEEAQRNVALTLVSDVATAYLELRELDANLAIARRTLDSRTTTLRLARRRFEQGIISELDVRQFEAQVAQPAAQIADFERQVRQKENQLSVLIGHAPGTIPRGRPLDEAANGVAVPADIPSTMVERRPDVRQAEQQYRAATARIGAAQGALLPKFTLTGQYGTQSTNFDNLFKKNNEIYQLFGGVSIPLFTGGKVGQQVPLARARAEQARYTYEQTVLTALREVNDALVALNTARDQFIAQQRQVDALRRALQLADMRYQNGISSYLDVLDAQRSLFTAELELTSAERLQLVSSVQLFKALGGGWAGQAGPDAAAPDSTRR